MRKEFTTKSGRQCKLVRGTKYTKLFINNMDEAFQMWSNETLAFILKDSDFDNQVEYFMNNLK